MSTDKIKALLESKNVTNIKYYSLINNSGYTFEYRGIRFDLRHWRNVYGAECNFYSLSNNCDPKNREEWIKEFTEIINKEANAILRESY